MNEKHPGGRPSIYTEELADRICDAVATHPWGIKRLCAHFDWMPTFTTIYQWRWKRPEFSQQFTKAKIAQAELYAEDCIDIADDSGFDAHINEKGEAVCDSEAINRARLRVDARKWMSSKLLPRLYGEQGRQEKSDTDSSLRDELLSICEELRKKNEKEY